MRRLSLLFVAFLIGCPEPEPEPEPDPEPIALPDIIPTEWLESLSGTITNDKTYVSGALAGETCTEVFEVAGADISEIVPEECAQCDIVYGVFLTTVEDCPGGDDLQDEGEFGLDLRQDGGEAVMWWFFQGWFSSDWTELGTATLFRQVDELDAENPADTEGLTLDMHYEFEDPDNGSWWANYATEDPCELWEPCNFDGYYTMDLHIDFVVDADWLAEQQQAE